MLAKCDTKLDDISATFEAKAPEDAMAEPEDQCSSYGDLADVKAQNTPVSDAGFSPIFDSRAALEAQDPPRVATIRHIHLRPPTHSKDPAESPSTQATGSHTKIGMSRDVRLR